MEEWKTVIINGEVYNNYMVSNLGNVKSLKDRYGKEKILKSTKNRNNYLIINLCKDGKQKTYYVHRLVAEAFLPKIDGKNHVDHIDSNKQNNNVNNLRWCSQKENCNFDLAIKHKSESMKGKTGALHNRSKAVICIEMNKIFGSAMEASRELGINNRNISSACNGKYKSSGKHPVTGEKLHWKYIDLLPCYNEEVNNCDRN